MLRVLAVDDEKYMLQSVMNVIKQCNATIVAGFTRASEALAWFRENHDQVDVAFLDISMPVMNGFALADALLSVDDNLPVVFVTAYDSYAIKAFEKAALDYVLKPAHVDRIAETLARVEKRVTPQKTPADGNGASEERLKLQDLDRDILWEKKRTRSALLKLVNGNEHADDVLLFRDGTWEWVPKSSIASFSRDKTDKYVQVLARGMYYETVEGMAEFQENFEESDWIVCFRAVKVCLRHIDKLEKGNSGEGAYLTLKDSKLTIPVSRGYLDDVAVKLYEYSPK